MGRHVSPIRQARIVRQAALYAAASGAPIWVDAAGPDCGFASRFNAYGYGVHAWQHWPRWLRAPLRQVAALSPFIAHALRVCGLADGALAG